MAVNLKELNLDMISSDAKIVVIGNRASGKTTLLTSLIGRFNTNTNLIMSNIESTNRILARMLPWIVRNNFYKRFVKTSSYKPLKLFFIFMRITYKNR